MIVKVIKDAEGNQCLEFTDEQLKELGIDQESVLQWSVEGGNVMMRTMSPQEISDHKRKWMMASYFESRVHIDLRSTYTEWLKENCFKHQYDLKHFTDVYSDTVRFEHEEDFNEFNDWYNQL